jgi:hypothetical protein
MTESAAAAATESTGAETVAPADQGGEVIDYGEILARHQSELARSGKTVEELRNELGKTHGTIDRVRKAFVGDDETEKQSPYQRRIASYNDLGKYLQQEALENQKKGGQGLPVTTKIGQQLVELGLESEQRAETLERELAEIKAKLKRQENPAWQGLERAAFIMEGMVDEGLESLYGTAGESKQIRAAQFNAVTARINAEIQDLMKNDPEALLKVQRNPKVMRRMVNHFMAEMLPPKVRSMLDDERIKNEPFESRDLMQAFAEAREAWETALEAGNDKDATQYSNLMTSIRHDILATQQAGRRSSPEKPSLNQLFRNSVGGGRR